MLLLVCWWLALAADSRDSLAQEAATSEWRQRFLSEYPAAAGKLRQSIEHLVANGQRTYRSTASSTSASVTFSYLGANAKSHLVFPDHEEVRCSNPEKLFHLERRDASLPWRVVRVVGPLNADKMYGFWRALDVDVYCRALFSLYDTDFSEWMSKRSFVLDDVAVADSDSGEQVTVRGHLADETEHWFRRASVTLSPSHSWAICAIEADYTPEAQEVSSTVFAEITPRDWSGVWFPQSVQYRTHTISQDGRSHELNQGLEFRDAANDLSLTESDFTMQHYSVPEIEPILPGRPVGAPSRQHDLFIIVSILAILATLLSWVLNRRKQSRTL